MQRRKPTRPKRSDAAMAASQANFSVSDLQEQLKRQTRELEEARDERAALAGVLQVISSSPGELEPVFQAMLENAVRICNANFGNIYRWDGDSLRLVATHNTPRAYAELRRSSPFRPSPETTTGRMIATKSVTHVTDLAGERGYAERDPLFVAGVEVGGIRTLLSVPMLKKNDLIGALSIYRQEVRPFTGKQIELVSNFAAQAVIAIENARLLNELRQRTTDLSEALEQQTATSEILGVIAASPTNIRPVLQAIAENACRLCEAYDSVIYLREGDRLRGRAHHGAISILGDGPIDRGWVTGRAFVDREPVHVQDLRDAADQFPDGSERARRFGHRTTLGIPLLREDEAIGTLLIRRDEVRPFTDKQIALLTTFARQAVIAIENVRLFEAEQARTRELTESLQQQTATADVLKVISRSAFDLQIVLDTLCESAVQLCDADHAWLFRRDGKFFRWAASFGHATEVHARIRDYFKDRPVPVDRSSVTGRAALEARVVHLPDVLADKEYTWSGAQQIGGYRAALGAPLLREGKVVGVLFVAKTVPEPYTDKQIELVTTFADQAVIAIENVRLFDEIQAKSRQLAEASQHKSQFLANMSHELRTPLNAIIGVTEMLREDAEELKQDTEPLDRVLSAGRHLLALINDILDLSKIEAGRMELNLETFALAPLINDVVKTIGPLAAKNGNQVAVHSDAAIGTIHADQMRLRQALLNLMSNANKFTEKGTVAIAAHRAQENGRDWITLSVADTGIGMTADQVGKLFQEFSQASSKTASKYGGTGLGLVISRRFCQMMGGDITVASAPGRGSTFTIHLPMSVENPKEGADSDRTPTEHPVK
jgi:two-component system NtrC family sensor kinase